MGKYCQEWSMWSGAHSPLLDSNGQDVVILCIYAMNLKLSSFHKKSDLRYKTNWKIARHFTKIKLNNDGGVQTFEKYVQSITVDQTNLPKKSLKHPQISMIQGWVKFGGQISF